MITGYYSNIGSECNMGSGIRRERISWDRSFGHNQSRLSHSCSSVHPASKHVPVPLGPIGEFILTRYITGGGMGDIYEAVGPSSERVAVKLAWAGGVCNQLLREEAETLQNVRGHDNVLTYYSHGADGEKEYLATELIFGCTVREMMDRQPNLRLPVSKALDITLSVLYGLAYVHSLGIVHRDIKPENVMGADNGVIKIIDFGLARPFQKSKPDSGKIIGTPYYLSPEQARCEQLTAASDLFSLGSMLVEMLAGKHPFQKIGLGARNGWATIQSIINDPVPAELLAALPPGLSPIASQMLEKDLARRYHSAGEVIRDLAAWRQGQISAGLAI